MESFKDIWFISNQQQGQPIEWLDGDTEDGTVDVQPSIMTAPADCNLTGTMWRLTGKDGIYQLRCLGSDDPSEFYLDGDTTQGGVRLNTDEHASGTRWTLISTAPNYPGGYILRCQGTSSRDYQDLQLVGNEVQLAPKNTIVDGTIVWYLYQVSPAPPLGA